MLTYAAATAAQIGVAFDNNGTIEATAGQITLSRGGISSGTFSASGGDINFSGSAAGGTHTLNTGASLTASGGSSVGLNSSAATLDIEGNITADVFDFSLGTLTGSGTFHIGSTLNWTGGTMTGSGGTIIDAGANLALTSGTATVNRSFTNQGTATTTGGSLSISAGQTFDNQGDFEIQNTSGVPIQGTGTFLNEGTFQKTLNSGTVTVTSVFDNQGSVEALTGTLQFSNVVQHVMSMLTGGFWNVISNLVFTTGANITTIGAGASVYLQNGGNFSSLSALTENDGEFSVINGATFSTVGDFSNQGDLEVSNGKLTVNGNFTQTAAGTLYNSFYGTDPVPSDFSQIAITGTATLDGTLDASFHFGYVADKADTFQILTYASRSGDFATVTLPSYNGHALISADPEATFYNLAGTAILVNSTADSGSGSLRDSIDRANTDAGSDLILFHLTGGGPYTIQPLTALPAITETVVIDGTFAEGYAGTPIVELRGDMVGSNPIGLEISGSGADGTVIRGLVINHFNSGFGIYIGGASGVTIAGNYIGTDVTGTVAQGNTGIGLLLDSGASNNTIGGTTAEARNIISGNDYGLDLLGAGTTGNTVIGNYIGTDITGTVALGNSSGGILIANGATDNTIGGTTAAERNIISGNNTNGVKITDAGTDGNIVAGNYIGTDFTGLLTLGNTADGILLENGASNNTIGGNGVGAGNLISGNGTSGILLGDGTPAGAADHNTIQGNIIGTDINGTHALANAANGIVLYEASNNTLDANIVSGNQGDGIYVTGSSTDNTITANRVGTNLSGTASIANTGAGIYLTGSSSGTQIGTDGDGNGDAAEGNLISGNTLDGIVMDGSTVTGTMIAGNRIGTTFSGIAGLANGAAGIRLWNGAGNARIGTNGDGLSDDLESNLISGNAGSGIYAVAHRTLSSPAIISASMPPAMPPWAT